MTWSLCHDVRSVRIVIVAGGACLCIAVCNMSSWPRQSSRRYSILVTARPERTSSQQLNQPLKPPPEPLKLPNSALEPIDWNALGGWATDDHAAAFATFVASCRPLLRTILSKSETRPMYLALTHVCRQALAAGRPTAEQARMFFEYNFRPLRITKLGENAGFLTGYYEPIVEGSRVPTGIFKVPIYRRPRDLVPPPNSAGPGFPNRGQSLRRTPIGELVRAARQ